MSLRQRGNLVSVLDASCHKPQLRKRDSSLASLWRVPQSLVPSPVLPFENEHRSARELQLMRKSHYTSALRPPLMICMIYVINVIYKLHLRLWQCIVKDSRTKNSCNIM